MSLPSKKGFLWQYKEVHPQKCVPYILLTKQSAFYIFRTVPKSLRHLPRNPPAGSTGESLTVIGSASGRGESRGGPSASKP